MRQPFCIVLICQFLFLTCGSEANGQTVAKKPTEAQIRSAWKDAGWKLPPNWSVVSDDKAVENWGRQVQNAIAEQDEEKFGKQLVHYASLARFSAGAIKNKEIAKGYQKGAMEGFRRTFDKFAHPEASYRFQRVLQTQYGPAALMRFVSADMNLNYHLWYLQKDPNGKVFGVDMYMFVSGESFGAMMRRLAILSLPQNDRSFIDKMMGRDLQLAKHQQLLGQILKNSQSGNHQEVLELYWRLPADLQREKFLLLVRMMASQKIGDDEYKRTLEDIQRFHPNDAFKDLAGLDLNFFNKKFDKYLAGVKKIESIVGPDAHLYLLRHGALSEQNKHDQALQQLRKAEKLEPDYENVKWTLVAHFVEQKQIAQAVDVLRKLAADFGYIEFDFTGVADYEDLQSSDLLKKLNESLAKQQAEETVDDGTES